MTTICKEVEVEFDIRDIEDDELLDELESRGLAPKTENLQMIADALNLGKNDQAFKMLEELIYQATGRIVYVN